MPVAIDNVTCHGLSRLGDGSKIEKRSWLAVVVVMIVLSVYFTYSVLTSYFKYDVVSTVETVYLNKVRFPSVILCDQGVDWYDDDTFEKDVQYLEEKFGYFCFFNGENCKVESLGRGCISFNMKGDKYQQKNVHRNGLFLHVFINETKPLKTGNLNPYTNRRKNYGISVSITEPNKYINPEESKIRLQAGSATIIGLKSMLEKRLPRPYPSKCLETGKLSDVFPGDYTVQGCQVSCYGQMLYDKCNYSDPQWYRAVKDRYKEHQTFDVQCIQDLWINFINERTPKCDCPVPCEENKYIITALLTEAWPNKKLEEEYIQLLQPFFPNHVVNKDFLNRHLARLEISFDTFQMEIRKEHEKNTIAELFSRFGGIIGVYLGASFISVIEIFLLTVKSVKSALRVISKK